MSTTEYAIGSAVIAGLLIVPQIERFAFSIFMYTLFFVVNPDWQTNLDKW